MDLVANLAVLGTPDNRAYPEQCATFSAFVEGLALSVSREQMITSNFQGGFCHWSWLGARTSDDLR